VFEALGVPDFRIHISNRRVLGDLLAACGCSPESLTLVLRIIDKSPKIGVPAAKQQIVELGLGDKAVAAVFDLVECKTPVAARELLVAHNAATDGVDALESVLQNAAALGMPEGRMVLDLSIARGLDYYTGTVFETFVVGSEKWGSVCSGGRYDDLAAFFSKEKYPGVGVSIGLSRLLDLLVDAKIRSIGPESPAKVLVTMLDRPKHFAKYLEIAADLRRAGIATEVFFEDATIGKQLAYAEKKGIPFAVNAGDAEFDSGTVKVKEIRERREEVVERGQVVAKLSNLLGLA
jgi:histidyl-tRNA synthetase